MAPVHTGGERRKFPRVPLNVTIAYQLHKPAFVRVLLGIREKEAKALNISQGGMSFLTQEKLVINTPLSIEFMLYEPQKEERFIFYRDLKAVGKVRYCVDLGNSQYLTGISFDNINEDDQLEIMRFVKKGISSEMA